MQKGMYTLKGGRVNPTKDQMIFKHTADKTKKINVKPMIVRGGIRL